MTQQAVIPEPTEEAATGPSGDAAPAGAEVAATADPSADAATGLTDGEPAGGWHPLLRVLVTLGTVAVFVGLGVFVMLRYDVIDRLIAADPTADARVGDCLARLPEVAEGGQRQAEARIVACASPDAAYDVVGRLDGLTGQRAGEDGRCEPFVAEGGTYYTYRSVPPGGTGYLLCLRPRG